VQAGDAVIGQIHGVPPGLKEIKQIGCEIAVIFDQKNIHCIVLDICNVEISLAGYSLPLPVMWILKSRGGEFTGISFIVFTG
jgi:hypothetical protein